jgi:hypothetical protein
MIDPRPLSRLRLAAGLLAAAAVLPAAALEAQTCRGTASFDTQPVRLGGVVSSSDDVSLIGLDLAFGEANGSFGGVRVGIQDFDGTDESATQLTGTIGYQIPLGVSTRGQRAGGPQVCPIGSLGLRLGPNVDGGPDTRGLAVAGGFSLGAPVGLTETVNLVPFGGLQLVYARNTTDFENGDDDTTTDSYASLDVGAGFTFSDRFTIRPSIDIPLGLRGADTGFTLLFALNFGGPR